MKLFKDLGKREGLVYAIVFLWIVMGIIAAYKQMSLSDLAVYFGSLTAYAATYIWAETKRPSLKSGILKAGPSSRREVMIYVVVALWAIAGVAIMWYKSSLTELSIYFASLTGFVAAWIAGERYQPEDNIKSTKKIEE